MKKVTIGILAYFFSICLNAQDIDIGLRLGFNATKNSETATFKIYPNELHFSFAFHCGPLVKFPIYKNILAIEFAPIFNTKGYAIKPEFSNLRYVSKLNLHYLDIPLHFLVAAPLNSYKQINFLFGPYIGIGLFGKLIVRDPIVKFYRSISQTTIFGNDPFKNIYRRIDAGINLGLEYQIENFKLGLFYDQGLIETSARTTLGISSKTRVFRASLAILFFNL